MTQILRNSDRWDKWNRGGGPRYPHAKVIQFVFRNYPRLEDRQGKKALDLGCGSGVNILFLASEGFTVFGNDISSVGVENTRLLLQTNGLNADLRVASATELPWADKMFDLIVSVGVLDCMGIDLFPLAIAESIRVLSPGGRALLIFASEADFRVGDATPFNLYGFRDEEVLAAISPWKDILKTFWLDRYITTYRERTQQQNDHLVTIEKKNL